MGHRRSTRLNVTISGAAPPPRVSTTGTTAVVTRGEVYGVTTMTQAMSLRAQRIDKLSPSLTPTCAIR
ncbi:hypothetical protein FF1_032423 [Malus domestica]